MKFSQRIGITPYKTELENENLSPELLNLLWSAFLTEIIENKKFNGNQLDILYKSLWLSFFKLPIDDLPLSYGSVSEYQTTPIIRKWFFKAQWYEVLDFIEHVVLENPKEINAFNNVLKQERSAYRFVNEKLVELNSEEEIKEIETAINSHEYTSVKSHLKRAVELYSDRKNPDYRNSIKESISSVESVAKIIVGNDKTTLGQALKEIEKQHKIPNSLKSAFSSLYGFTSDEGGIRHSLLESSVDIDMEEARFMLIACSAFVNYLLSKI